MARKAAFHSLGCKVNSYETDAMRQSLLAAGYEEVPFMPGADIYVINTCTVTNIADRKSRQMLHKAKEMNPDAVVVAAGCYVQDAEESLLMEPLIRFPLAFRKLNAVLLLSRASRSAGSAMFASMMNCILCLRESTREHI